MKLIIQIPCYNEEDTLASVFEKMPKEIDGIDQIEYQIIDDGSTDKTVEVAKELGVDWIISYNGKNRRWLGRAFKLGIDNALKQGADILVNTDGDNQYPSEMIPELIQPILDGEAEIVIGDRETQNVDEFSWFKKKMQKFGSWVAKTLSGGDVPDAVSGFRAYSSTALKKINITTNYTYTVDTLMQANKKGLDIAWIKIRTNKKTRESRLIKNMWTKIKKSGGTIIKMYVIYEPFKTFALMSSVFFFIALILFIRYGYYFFTGDPNGHVQSLVVGGFNLMIAIQLFALGIIAELFSVNRKLIEDLLERTK